MGITTCGRHKRSKSGAKRAQSKKKRKNVMGRQPSNTKVGEERIREVRVRGGNIKNRALRLNQGEFQFYSAGAAAVAEIDKVVYHPSCNELMRTNTLTKGSVVKISAAPFAECIAKEDLSEKDPTLMSMYSKGHLYAIITSRPGQEGAANGYVLQGEELEFFKSKVKQPKSLVK
ncbi:small subunit ribosomal protein S8e [Enteropsectra breve]|nr:small subunit ribosomal protein S8e [Enteropsectra breve]